MARGQTLESILNKVRAKARLSLLPANNTQVRDSHILLIQAEQDRLWEDFNWPHLRVHEPIPLAAGQFTYAVPDGLVIDRVEYVCVRDGGRWRKLGAGIGDGEYSVYESALDERSWPVRRWQPNSDDDIEIWPIPDQNGDADTLEGYIRVTGIRDLAAFIEDADRADLDDELISDYVAGGILAATGAKDAQLRLEAANKRYVKLKGKQTKSTSFNMFGTVNRGSVRRRMVAPHDPGS